MDQNEKIRIAMIGLVEAAQVVAPYSAKLAKLYYNEGIKAGLTEAQAWEFAMHGIKSTSANIN